MTAEATITAIVPDLRLRLLLVVGFQLGRPCATIQMQTDHQTHVTSGNVIYSEVTKRGRASPFAAGKAKRMSTRRVPRHARQRLDTMMT
jgi:hypothetical protein